MYLESDLGSVGAVSYLYSPTLKGMRSINFWYHMYGNARTAGNNYMGTLAVEAHTGGTTWVSVWSKSGAQNYGYTVYTPHLLLRCPPAPPAAIFF